MNKVTMTVNYGTIKGMLVNLPTTYTCMDLLRCWVTGYIKYMTTNCICSEECLISSIGASNARTALDEGIKQRCEDINVKEHFLNHMSDKNWRYEILRQRLGERAAFTDLHGEEKAAKFAEICGFAD